MGKILIIGAAEVWLKVFDLWKIVDERFDEPEDQLDLSEEQKRALEANRKKDIDACNQINLAIEKAVITLEDLQGTLKAYKAKINLLNPQPHQPDQAIKSKVLSSRGRGSYNNHGRGGNFRGRGGNSRGRGKNLSGNNYSSNNQNESHQNLGINNNGNNHHGVIEIRILILNKEAEVVVFLSATSVTN
ncbi:hypothetical protein LWI28_008203 [Acer negundo]|uniref:Uncharacterized protein n=1 Tax=Acer negundo TaxID=4023 RepID=A0AAD5I621_ACENE|nr:hypothetical protein LWI28_008203 [Acer negundo]